MGADRPDAVCTDDPPAVVIAIQNPGDDTQEGTPPPMLAVPVRTAEELMADNAPAADSGEDPPILHVRCSGCSLIVQFPLIPDVRRHGIICSVCTTVSYPYVDAHLFGPNGRGLAWSEEGAGDGDQEAQRVGAPRAFLPGRRDPGDGSVPVRTEPMTGQATALAALARVTKWFAAIDVFIVIVEALTGTARSLLGRYNLLALLAVLPPVVGYVGASRFDYRLVSIYFAYCMLMIGYNAFITYLEPTIWKLLLLLLEVYMARIVLRFTAWLLRLAPGERDAAVGELRAHGRASLAPW